MLLDRALEENAQVTDIRENSCCLQLPQLCRTMLLQHLSSCFWQNFFQAAVQGIVVIYDIGGVTPSHTLMMTPAIMKKHVVVFQVGKDMYYSLIMRS